MRARSVAPRLFAAPCLLAFALAACGGGSPGEDSSSGGDEPASDRCGGYSPTDPCMNEASFAQCREMAARCPGEVQVLESCPLQFACPSQAGGDCDRYGAGDACVTEENLAQCREMAARCPRRGAGARVLPAPVRLPLSGPRRSATFSP
ncbi:MAG: hypothetical protein M5U28_41615 [Sandaracinaceae bacterium]|nr:hypothetical protein [Sandaracinaceae bacterium]